MTVLAMKSHRPLIAILVAAAVMAGCKDKASDAADILPPPDAAAVVAQQEPEPDALVQAGSPAEPQAAAAPAAFDIASVPVSDAPLGDWPYFGMPAGYKIDRDRNYRFEKAPFWTGRGLEWVEGKVYEARIAVVDGDYAPREVTHNLDAMVRQLGGVRVVEDGKLGDEAITAVREADIDTRFPLGMYTARYNLYPVSTWVVRRPDRTVWMHYQTHGTTGGEGELLIAESAPFQASAQLLVASQMKQQIDATGKVALQVNFATDKTDVLPDSLPQVEQVVTLLKEDPALRLAVNGHTDDSGDAVHNQQLSEGRAKAVVALLVGQGIDAARLTAAGFGSAQPAAENSSPEGKAKNRRVELVKQ